MSGKGKINISLFVKRLVFDGVPASQAIVDAGSQARTPGSRKQVAYQYKKRCSALIRKARAMKRRANSSARKQFVAYLRERNMKQ